MSKNNNTTLNLRPEGEVDRLMDIFKALPTPTTEPTIQELPQKEHKWKHRSTAPKNMGRVNRTKGK